PWNQYYGREQPPHSPLTSSLLLDPPAAPPPHPQPPDSSSTPPRSPPARSGTLEPSPAHPLAPQTPASHLPASAPVPPSDLITLQAPDPRVRVQIARPSSLAGLSSIAPTALLPDKVLLSLPQALSPSHSLARILAYCLLADQSPHIPHQHSPPSRSHRLSLPPVHRDSPTAHPAAPGTASAIAH